jgi:ppGpp synthetase/RelA/SpoT-type nucleotidyltranferase
MPFTIEIIDGATARYARERDRYVKLAARVADICQAFILEGDAVRAQVTSRTKTPQSFRTKLERFSRRADRNYATVDEVFGQGGISDFAGVRIATYRPEDEERVRRRICDLFCGPDGGAIDVDLKNKLNPTEAQFYRATHCQVFLRGENLAGIYDNLRGASCEVQICSMMAHVWNEIEHDIGYKPDGGGPDPTERGLLEALGHLARSGDATITRLLEANQQRLRARQGEFSDVHDFVARLRDRFPRADLSVNAGQAYDAVRRLGLLSPDRFEAELGAAALDEATARKTIESFNRFAREGGRTDATLNAASADLLTVGLLPLLSERRSVDKPDGADRLSEGRLSQLVDVWREMTSAPYERSAAG